MAKFIIIIFFIWVVFYWIIFILKWVFYFVSSIFSYPEKIKQKKEQIEKKQIKLKQKFGNRIINKNLSLLERNEDIIMHNVWNVKPWFYNNYYIENLVRDCLNDIAIAEWDFNIAPWEKFLKNWSQNQTNNEYIRLKDSLIKRFKDMHEYLNHLEKEKKIQQDKIVEINRENEFQIKITQLKEKHSDLIKQFFEITERKVSIIDDYWDENWEELIKQTDILIIKIAKKEWYSDDNIKHWKKYEYSIPKELKTIKQHLNSDFKIYHEKLKWKVKDFDKTLINEMTWIDFEIFLSKKFKEFWYEVSWTSATWDQWADLIIKKNWKKIIIQAKRYSNSVWNKAVQEVVWAINYYHGDEWYVITNSYFTNSAKALAQKNNIKLIDWFDLNKLDSFF
jgi:hypothetical protein